MIFKKNLQLYLMHLNKVIIILNKKKFKIKLKRVQLMLIMKNLNKQMIIMKKLFLKIH